MRKPHSAKDKTQGQASKQPFFSARSSSKEAKSFSGQRGIWMGDISLGFVSGPSWCVAVGVAWFCPLPALLQEKAATRKRWKIILGMLGVLQG